MKRLLHGILFFVACTLLIHSQFGLLCAQEQPAPAPSAAAAQYPDTSDGLRSFLEEVRAAAKDGRPQKLTELVKQAEIPNYRNWFYSAYPTDRAENWTRRYNNELQENEENFRQIFARIANTNGRMMIRKVNDESEPGKRLARGILDSARIPLDIYFASWRSDSAGNYRGETIGNFIFIDGMFRWFSLIHSLGPRFATSPSDLAGGSGDAQPAAGPPFKVGPSVTRPKLISSTMPQYSESARKAGLEGTVQLSVVVDIDGHTRDIRVVRSLGGGLDEQAVDAVREWKFEPGKKDGEPVPVQINIEVSFH